MRRTVQVAENGRMNLPAEMRRGLGLSGSGRVILTLARFRIGRHLCPVLPVTYGYTLFGRMIAPDNDDYRCCSSRSISNSELGGKTSERTIGKPEAASVGSIAGFYPSHMGIPFLAA
jgi:hypothetical protein